jgi:hypothetical protein
MSAYIKRTEGSQINNLMLHLKLLQKPQQGKLKKSGSEIIKIRAKINEIETKKHTKNQQNKKLLL